MVIDIQFKLFYISGKGNRSFKDIGKIFIGSESFFLQFHKLGVGEFFPGGGIFPGEDVHAAGEGGIVGDTQLVKDHRSKVNRPGIGGDTAFFFAVEDKGKDIFAGFVLQHGLHRSAPGKQIFHHQMVSGDHPDRIFAMGGVFDKFQKFTQRGIGGVKGGKHGKFVAAGKGVGEGLFADHAVGSVAVNGKEGEAERFSLRGKFVEFTFCHLKEVVIPESPFAKFGCLRFDFRVLPIHAFFVLNFFNECSRTGKVKRTGFKE